MEMTHALAERIGRFGEGVELLETTNERSGVEAHLEEARRIFASVQFIEARHIDAALAGSDFPFELAQAELRSCRRELARLVEKVCDRCATLLPEQESRKLREIAFLSERAPLTDRGDLETIRVAEAERIALSRMRTTA